jgi:RHS repeat-associated protein
MNTEPGIGFSSRSVPVFFGPSSTSPLLRFSFGFATDEVLRPGILPDSLTLTLQDAAQQTTLLLVTMDAGGAVWAPVTPGTTPIAEGSLDRLSIPYSSLTPVLSSRSAFALEFAVPADLVGESLTLYFDLFSNDDGVRSQAWFSKVEVVPEPSALVLLALGGGWILRSGRRNLAARAAAPTCAAETSADGPQNLLAVRSMNVRWSARWLPLLFLLALLRPVDVQAQEKVFRLQGVDQALVNVSPETDVYFRSVRLNRALNVWNVEVTVSNKTSRTLSGPVVLLIESFQGTGGPVSPDGLDDSQPGKAFYELSVGSNPGALLPGRTTTVRTLTLSRLGTASISPSLNPQVYAAPTPVVAALGVTRSLDEVGRPLPGVSLSVSGPKGTVEQVSDVPSGVASFGQGAGDHRVVFGADGYLPVWRRQTLATDSTVVLPNPRLTRRSDHPFAVTPAGGMVVSNSSATIQMVVPQGAVAAEAEIHLTPVTGQTLPAFLPQGWSPLSAFWIESSRPLQKALSAVLLPAGPIAAGETAALVRWNDQTLQWMVTAIVSGNEGNAVTVPIDAAGAYALVVADAAELAPPAPQSGQPLAASAVSPPDVAGLTATGTVTPAVSPASVVPERVTGTARVELKHATAKLPSGWLLRGEVTETYLLIDGSIRLTPQYEHFIVGYQRPGDADAQTLGAEFPMRPVLLFGPEQLKEATVRVDVLPEQPFDGQVLDAKGGQMVRDGVRLLAGTGTLTGPSALRLRRLDATAFTNLVGNGHVLTAAFDLTVDGSTVGSPLGAQLGGAPANARFVLARILSETGYFGLQPVERLQSDAQGALQSLEPASGDRLPGLRGSGQFLLVQVNEPQGLIRGVARTGAGTVRANLPVSLAGLPWLALTDAQGRYELVSPAGSRELSVRDPATGDVGRVQVTVTNPGTPLAQDLDTAPRGPRVAKITPAANATRVPRVGSVVIEFDEPVNPASVVNAIQMLKPDNSPVPAAMVLNLANRIATLSPATELDANTLYRVSLAATIADPSGLPLEGVREFTFTTVPLSTRDPAAQLIIYQPGATNVPVAILDEIPAYEPGTNAFEIIVHGTPGVSDPEVAVILVNESTGQTATVLSKPDGSFSSVINGTEDDFVSATFVNLNGTRVYVPVSRQIFDNGFVGLYPQGGILEAQSDGGPVQVLIEPKAIETKTKLRLTPMTAAQLAELLGDVEPEGARTLAKPLVLEGDGQPMSGPLKVRFTVDLRTGGYPTNSDPTEAAIALVNVTDTDGVKAFEVLDQLVFTSGSAPESAAAFGSRLRKPITRQTTPEQLYFGTVNSVIGLIPQAGIANNIFRYVLMPLLVGGKPIVVKGRVIQSLDIPQLNDPFKANHPLLQGFKFEQLGSPFKVLDLASQGIGGVNNVNNFLADLLEGHPLGGAFVTLQNVYTPSVPGRVRPGMVYATSARDGSFLMVAPTTPFLLVRPEDFYLVMATHPRFREKLSEKMLALQDLSIAGVVFKNFVFREPLALQVPPLVNVSHSPPYPAAGEAVEVQVNASQGFQGNPSVAVFVEQAFPAGQPLSGVKISNINVSTNGNRTRWSARVQATNTIRRVMLRVSALPSAGEPKVVHYPISFTGAPQPSNDGAIPPSDPTEKKGPSVTASFPTEGGLVTESGELTLVFNEPIDPMVVSNITGLVISPTTPGAAPSLRLDPKQTQLTLHYAGLLPDTDYSLVVSGDSVMDLSGNPLDQRPSTVEADSFTLTFRTPPVARFTLPGLVNGAGSVIQGSRLYAIDNSTPPMLRSYDISDPTAPKLLGGAPVVGTPRDLLVIPNYSYKLNLHAPTRTNDLVVVVGGDLDTVIDDLDSVIVRGQYMRVFEMGDPANPVEIASPIVSYRAASAVSKVRWNAPTLVLQEFGADIHQLMVVDLQEHLIGRHATRLEADNFPDGGKEGKDANGDGDYADAGDSYPFPQRRPAEFYGKKQSYVISGSSQRMLDFSVAGGTIGVTLTGGYALTQGGRVDLGQPVFPQYRTIAFGGVEIGAGSVDFPSGSYPGRVTIIDGLPVEDGKRLYTPIVALVSLSPDNLGRDKLVAFDISLPESPKLIGSITFPAELSGGSLRSIHLREDGLLELATVSHVFHIDSRKLSQPAPPEGELHSALVGYLPQAGGRMRSLGTSLFGVRSAVEGGRNELVQTAPKLSFINFPLAGGLVDPRSISKGEDDLKSLMARAQPAESLVPARVRADHLGHNSDLFPANPEVHYHVLVEAPGGAGETIELGMESLSPAGWPLPNKGAGFPPVRAVDERTLDALGIKLRPECDAPVRPLKAYRMSNNRASPFFNRYLSRPLVVVYEAMSFSDLNLQKLQGDREILWSGARMRVFLDPTEQANAPIGRFVARVDVPRRVIFPVASAVAATLDVSYIMGPNPPPPGGDVRLPGTFGSVSSHSGEIRTEAADLSLPSPRIPISIQRVIGGQDNYDGPFGLGWDFNYNQRVTELQPQLFPQGFKMPLIARGTLADSVVGSSKDLLFHSGAGRIVLFEWKGDTMPPEYAADPLVAELKYAEIVSDYFLPEPGVFDLLVKFKDGKFERLTPDGMRYKYAANGRLETIVDRFPKNRHEMEYERNGWLRRIDDRSVSDDRFVEFGYYRRDNDSEFVEGLDLRSDNAFLLGKVCRLRDYAGRDVLYFYSDDGLLIRREGVKVDGENGGFSGRNQTHYLYTDCRFAGLAVGPNKVSLLAAVTQPGSGGVPVTASVNGAGGSTQTAIPADNLAQTLEGLKTSTTQADGRITEFTFNKFGQPSSTKVSGPGVEPAVLNQAHNEHGQVTFAQYPEGRSQRMTYDSSNPIFRSRGNLIEVSVDAGPRGGAGYTETHRFDPYYNLPSGGSTDANGFTITSELSSDHRFVRTIRYGDAGSEVVDLNEHGQLVSRVDPDGIETGFDFNSSSGFMESSKKGPHVTRFTYGSLAGLLGQPTSAALPRGAEVSVEYNANLQIVHLTRGENVQRMAYDAQGRRTFHEETLGGGKRRQTRLTIKELGFISNRTINGIEVNGTETALEYVYTPDEVFRVKKVLHPGGLLQEFTRNALGHQTKMQVASYVEEYTTDLHGNVLSVKKGGDIVATAEYDGLDRPKFSTTLTGTQSYLVERTYFPAGQIRTQKATDPIFGVVDDRTISEIDALGRVVSSTIHGDTVSRTDTIMRDGRQRTSTGPRQTVTEEWNGAGYPTRSANAIASLTITTDGNGNVGRVLRAEDGASYEDIFSHNDLDQRQTASDSFGPVTEFTPRADGKNIETKNARGNGLTMEYSALGEVLSRRRTDGMEFRFRHDEQRQLAYSGDPSKGFDYAYDNQSRMTRRTLRDGAEIVNDSFDARNQPTSTRLPGGTMTMTYDLQARVKTSLVKFGSTIFSTATEYDALNRVRVVNYEQSGGSASRARFTYDKAGPLLTARFEEAGADLSVFYAYRNDLVRSRVTYPSGYVVNQERDAAGRLIRIHGTIEDIATVVDWQGNSQPKTVSLGGALQMANRYDARGRLTGSRYVRTPGGALQAELRYQYDAANNVEMRQFLHRAGKTDNFSYDNGERLVRAQIGGIPLDGGTDLTRLTYQRSYNYQPTGLDYLLTAPATVPAGLSAPPFSASWSGHDAFLLPGAVNGVSRTGPDAMGRVAQAQLWSRPAAAGEPVPIMANLGHNGLGQLVRIERADGLVIENFFQSGGLRYARKVTQAGSVTDYRHYVYDDAGRLIEEFDRTGAAPVLLARYFYLESDAPCAVDLPDANGTLRRHYYIQDDQKSVVAVVDRFGVTEERVWYDPFGQPVIEPRDDTAPVIKRVIAGEGGKVLIEMSEPVTDIVFDLGPQAGIRRLTQSYSSLVSQPAGKTELPEVVPGYAPYTVIVFSPEEQLAGAVDLTLGPGKLTDDWDNHVLEQTVTATVTGTPGAVYYAAAGNPNTDRGTVARSSVGSAFLFHGQYFDYDTGLIYMRARFYDPFSAMFMEPDPLGYEDSVNLYAGMGNNPMTLRDPSGLVAIAGSATPEEEEAVRKRLEAIVNVVNEVSYQIKALKQDFGSRLNLPLWANSALAQGVVSGSEKFGWLKTGVGGVGKFFGVFGVVGSGLTVGGGIDQIREGKTALGLTDYYAGLTTLTINFVSAHVATDALVGGAVATETVAGGWLAATAASLPFWVASVPATVSVELARRSIRASIEGRETPVDVAWNAYTGQKNGVPIIFNPNLAAYIGSKEMADSAIEQAYEQGYIGYGINKTPISRPGAGNNIIRGSNSSGDQGSSYSSQPSYGYSVNGYYY